MNLAKQWTVDPAIVEIEPENVASDTVEQHVYAVAGSDKYKLLYNLVAQNNWERVMVFANRKDEVRRIEERLTKDGISAAQMSGDVPQHKRIRTLEGFREGKIRVLVATDVAGRGIHIDGISHVINFTLPEDGRLRAPYRSYRPRRRLGHLDQLRRRGRCLRPAADRRTAGPQDHLRDAAGRTAQAGTAQALNAGVEKRRSHPASPFRFCDTQQVPPSVIEAGRRLPGNTLKSRMDKLFTSIPEIA